MLVHAAFSPAAVRTLGRRLGVANGRMMMGAPACRDEDGLFGVREFGGVRVISD